MTTREYFQTVLDAHISEDMDTATQNLLKKLDERNEKRKSADTKEKRETAERRAKVLEYLKTATEPLTREAIAEATGLSAGQVSSACTALAESGVKKSTVTIDKARRVVYSYSEE